MKERFVGSLIAFLFVMQGTEAHGQSMQRESWCSPSTNHYDACDHTSHPTPGWKDVASACLRCSNNRLQFSSAETGVAESASCGSADTSMETAFIVALDSRDEALIRLADYHPAAAVILGAMLDSPEGVTPIDWANGVIPFSRLPSKASVLRMVEGRSGGDPDDPRIRGWRLVAIYFGNPTDSGFQMNLEFLSPDKLAADLAKLLGGTRIQVELKRVPGVSFVMTDDGLLDVPLHRIAAVSIDDRALDLALVR